MDFQPVPGDDDLLDHQPQDRTLDLEGRVGERVAKLLDEALDARNLADGKLAPGGLGAELGLLVLDGDDPLLDRRLARAKLVELERTDLVRIDQALALPLQLVQPACRQTL